MAAPGTFLARGGPLIFAFLGSGRVNTYRGRSAPWRDITAFPSPARRIPRGSHAKTGIRTM